ncbi:MAG: hypothetical protein ACJATN_000374 [Neolewinella sp.]|jgi:hypothetical protein
MTKHLINRHLVIFFVNYFIEMITLLRLKLSFLRLHRHL